MEPYIIDSQIGIGGYGIVYNAHKKYLKKNIACKQIPFEKKSLKEIAILRKLKNQKNIINMHTFSFEDDKINIFMELCDGGNIYNACERMPDKDMKEYHINLFLKQIINALIICHDKNIVHKDIKCDNFLLLNKDYDSELKMIDFGISQHVDEIAYLENINGNPYYIPPEALNKHLLIKPSYDIWSLGVLLHVLYSGVFLYNKTKTNDILSDLHNLPVNLDNIKNKNVKDLLFCMLQKDPLLRPSAKELLEFNYFNKYSIP
jgi:serine/threonine protein kinase